MKGYHHRELPKHSTLLSGHTPRDEIGFQSEQLGPRGTDRKPYVSRGELASRIQDNASIPAVEREKVLDILTRGS